MAKDALAMLMDADLLGDLVSARSSWRSSGLVSRFLVRKLAVLMRTSESKGHQQLNDSSAAFEPEVRNRTGRTMCANFGFAHRRLAATLRVAESLMYKPC